MFHLSVAKIDLNVGWSSEEERASTGAMAASDGKLAAALHWTDTQGLFFENMLSTCFIKKKLGNIHARYHITARCH